MCKIGQPLPFENKKILGEIENCSLEEIKWSIYSAYIK